MAFTIGSGTFTNGSATVTGVTLTSGTLAYFASGTRMVVGVNPVIQEVEAIAAPTVSTITLRSAWTGTGGTYSFLANQTSEGLRDAVQAIRTNNASLQSFIDSIDTAATADSVAQRTSDGSLNAVNVYASGNVGVGTSSPSALGRVINVEGSGSGASIAVEEGDNFAVIYSGPADSDPVNFISNAGFKFATAASKDATGFSEKVRIDNSGNVGIGTSSPAGLIHCANIGTTAAQIGVERSYSDSSALGSLASRVYTFTGVSRKQAVIEITVCGSRPNDTANQHWAGKVIFRVFMNSSGNCQIEGPTTLYDFTWSAASHFVFTDLGSFSFSVSIQNPLGATVDYTSLITMISGNEGSAVSLTSIS